MRFTVFNACTVVVMLAALCLALLRLRSPRPDSNFALLCYAVLLGYTVGFRYSLNPYVILGGTAIAIILRATGRPKLRWADLPILAYVLWRGAELLIGL